MESGLQRRDSVNPFEFQSSQPNPFAQIPSQATVPATAASVVLLDKRTRRPKHWKRWRASALSPPPSPPSLFGGRFKSRTSRVNITQPPVYSLSTTLSWSQSTSGVFPFRGLEKLEPQAAQPRLHDPKTVTTKILATEISIVETEPEPEPETEFHCATAEKVPDPSPARSAPDPATEETTSDPFRDKAKPDPSSERRQSERLKRRASSPKEKAQVPLQLPKVKRRAKRATPLNTPDRTDENDARSDEIKRAQDIDFAIEKKLKNPAQLGKKDAKQGYVYVAPAEHKGNKIIKIGFTTETDAQDRIRVIESQCGGEIRFLQRRYDYLNVPYYYKQVERLAQKELDNFQYNFLCYCGTKKHTEYFALDEKTGREVVQRWARFCQLGPYTDARECKLKEEWVFHLDGFRERNHGRDEKDQEGAENHFRRHERWETFLKSRKWDWLVKKAYALRWQLWSVVVTVGSVMHLPWLGWLLSVFTTVFICCSPSTREWVSDLWSFLQGCVAGYWDKIKRRDTSESPIWADAEDKRVVEAISGRNVGLPCTYAASEHSESSESEGGLMG